MKKKGVREKKRKKREVFLVFFEKSKESLRVSLREKVENDLDKIFLFSPPPLSQSLSKNSKRRKRTRETERSTDPPT
jgi:hypothetical protein